MTTKATATYCVCARLGAKLKFDNGFTITGGQMWSLVTETKKGADNRTEALPLTIDPQYTVGFSWARQVRPSRIQKTFGDEVKFTLAASVEGANTTLTVHGNPTTVLPASSTVTVTDGVTSVATPVITSTTFNNFLVGAPGHQRRSLQPNWDVCLQQDPRLCVQGDC